MGISLRRKLVAFGLVVLLARSLHKLLKILRRRKRLVPKARLLRLSCGHLFEFLRYGGFTDQFFKQLHKASEEEVVPFWIGNKEYFSIIGVSNSRVALQWCHDRKYSGNFKIKRMFIYIAQRCLGSFIQGYFRLRLKVISYLLTCRSACVPSR